MRVKLLIALAIASIFILASVLPVGAIEGVTGPSGVSVVVPTPRIVAPVGPVIVRPCISFPAAAAPMVVPCGPANLINLGGPAIKADILLSGPQIPSFSPPSFVLPILCPPVIKPFLCMPAMFDP